MERGTGVERSYAAVVIAAIVTLLLPGSAGAVPPSSGSDLSVTMGAAPMEPREGETVVFTVAVSNRGPGSAADVSLYDGLPAGFRFMSATPSVGYCAQSNPVTCALGTLAKNASAKVEIRASAVRGGDHTNTVSVSSSSSDPNAENNSASVGVSLEVPPGPPLPARCSGIAPPSRTCSATFTTGSAGTVRLALTERPAAGWLLAAIVDPASGQVVDGLSANFTAGQTTAPTSRLVALDQGTWVVAVTYTGQEIWAGDGGSWQVPCYHGGSYILMATCGSVQYWTTELRKRRYLATVAAGSFGAEVTAA